MPPRPCVLDTSLVLAFGKAGHVAVLTSAPGFALYITPRVQEEVRSPETRTPIRQAVLEGRIGIVEIDSDDENAMKLLAQWSSLVDYGEAETIAVALSRTWLVGTEDLAAQRQLNRRVGAGRWINAATVLLDCVAQGGLAMPDAESVFRSLDVYTAYSKAGVMSLAALPRNVDR